MSDPETIVSLEPAKQILNTNDLNEIDPDCFLDALSFNYTGQKIYEYLLNNGESKKEDIASETGNHPRTVAEYLTRFTKMGVVKEKLDLDRDSWDDFNGRNYIYSPTLSYDD